MQRSSAFFSCACTYPTPRQRTRPLGSTNSTSATSRLCISAPRRASAAARVELLRAHGRALSRACV
jgi:hypothetical protein